MDVYKYRWPICADAIQETFRNTLLQYGISLPEDSYQLFTGLNRLSRGDADAPECPFPLVKTVKSARSHAKKIQSQCTKPDKTRLGKCQQALAAFYGFSKWDFFLNSLDSSLNHTAASPDIPRAINEDHFKDFSKLGSSATDPHDLYFNLKRYADMRTLANEYKKRIDPNLPCPKFEYYGDYGYDDYFGVLLSHDLDIWRSFLESISPLDDYTPSFEQSFLEWDQEEIDSYTNARFCELIENPSFDQLKQWPHINAIPHIQKIIINGEMVRKLPAAEESTCSYYEPEMMLSGRKMLEIDGDARPIKLWAHLKHAFPQFPFQTESYNAQAWKIDAYFVLSEPRQGENPVLALCGGYYFAPFKGDHVVYDEDFFYMMDAESSELNDMAKVILKEILPDLGFFSLRDFHEEYFDASGILAPYPEIHPQHKGKGLLAPLLSLLKETISSSPDSVRLHNIEDVSCFNIDIFEDGDVCGPDGLPLASPWLGTPSALLFQVEGSPDIDESKFSTTTRIVDGKEIKEKVRVIENEEIFHGMKVENGRRPSKGPKIEKLELRKEKLGSHFRALEFEGWEPSIYVYDPEEYPLS